MGRPISNPNRKALLQRALYRLHRGQPGPCPDCGRNKSAEAMRCRSCAKIYRKDHAKTSPYSNYHREYMADYRALPPAQRSRRRRARDLEALAERLAERPPCRTRDCMYYGYDHGHCLCGLALAPTEHACPMCIAEQRRLEHKTWPKEDAAA